MEIPMPHHLFIVDGDTALRDLLADFLESRGYVVTRLHSGAELLHRTRQSRPDLVVLGIDLPGHTGLDICRRLRLHDHALPIILISNRADEADRLIGFELGADDCLCKPFSARELLARVRAVLRRAGGDAPTPRVGDAAPQVRLGGQVFDPASRSLLRGGQHHVLSTMEFALLSELVAHPGQPLSRERLLNAIHTQGTRPLARTVDTAVMRLRRLIEPNPSSPLYLQTVRGLGYVFVPPRKLADPGEWAACGSSGWPT
jgi:two-component system, OmpR family, phosphate regulon response regulator OmpR